MPNIKIDDLEFNTEDFDEIENDSLQIFNYAMHRFQSWQRNQDV